MKSFLGTLLVTITCIVSVYSLQCMYCENSNGTTCSGDVKECSHSEEKCGTSYYVQRQGEKTMKSSIVKGCKMPQECTNTPATLSNPNVTVSFGISCCANSSCALPENLFPTSKTQNNLTCTSCYSNSILQCYTKVTTKCSGSETKCGRLLIDSLGSVDEHWSMRGCATQEFCSHELVFPSKINIRVSEKECTDNSSVHRLSILVLAVAVFWTLLF